jgi:hypothetical protein
MNALDQCQQDIAKKLFIRYRRLRSELSKCLKQVTFYTELLSSSQLPLAERLLPPDLRQVAFRDFQYLKNMFDNDEQRKAAHAFERGCIYQAFEKIMREGRLAKYEQYAKSLNEQLGEFDEAPGMALRRLVPEGLSDEESDKIISRFRALKSMHFPVASFGSATAGATDNILASGDDNPLQDTDNEDDQFMQVDGDQDLRALVRNLKGTITTLSTRLEQMELSQKNFRAGSAPAVAKPRGGSRSKKPTGSFENRGRSRSRDAKQRRSASRQKSSSSEKTRRYRSNTPRRAGGGGGGRDSERKDKKGDTRKKNNKR